MRVREFRDPRQAGWNTAVPGGILRAGRVLVDLPIVAGLWPAQP